MDFKKQPRQTGDPVVSSSYPVIEVLVQGADPITADIVFVHGLGGHLRDTWTKDNVCWPQDLLSKEEALSHIRVLTFGYDANLVDLNGRASLNTLCQHSNNLLQELSRVRRKDAHGRPIIFIAHSLGGLIVKHALYYSNQVHDTHPHLAQIFSVTRGIIFLGTPHRGGGKTSIAKVVASVAQMALQNPPLDLIQDLERDSWQTLDRIGDGFGRILDKRTMAVWSFAEALDITGIGKVVPGELAIIGDPRENRGTIYGDHFSMVKFSTRDDPGYKKVVNSIEMLLEELGEGSLTPSKVKSDAVNVVKSIETLLEGLGEVSLTPSKVKLDAVKVVNSIEMLLKGLGEGSLTPSKVKSDAVGLQEAKSFYVIPPLRVPYFIGRETLYARLQALFDRATTGSAPSIVVLIGMGGAGKTQLALEYCQRMKDTGKFRAIFWLDASSRHTLYSSMETAAKHLIPDRVPDNPDAAVAFVNDVLSRWSERWLLVFDNLDKPEDLPGILSFIPANHHGSILITSRLAASKKLGQSIELDHMEKEEGLQLLLGSSREDTDAAEEILSLLGNLPLAIDQVQAYIFRRQLRLRAFVTEYERRKQSVMQETPQFWQYRRMIPGKEKEVSLNLLTTWEMSLQLLGVGEQAAELEKVITLFAFFNPVNIGERLFNNDADDGNPTSSPMTIFKEGGHWNHLKFEDAIVKMQELSLLQFSHCNESEIAVSLHPMVSEWLRMRLDKSSQSIFLNTAILHLQSHLGSIGHSDHKTRQEVQAHLDTIWRGVESFNLGDHILEACITFGNFYCDQGRLKDAEMVYNRALAGCERMLGHEHTFTLDAVNNLGPLYTDRGRLKDAEMMYNCVLAGVEKALGPEHPTTLSTINNLGLLYTKQGRLKDAEMVYNRALAGREKAEHKSTLDTVNSLGCLYTDQGRLKDAMYNPALAGTERAGPEHTSALDTINHLGLLCTDQGLLKDVETMCNRAVADKEKASDPEHPSMVFTANKKSQNVSVHPHFEDFLGTPLNGEFGTSLMLPLFPDFEIPYKAEESVPRPQYATSSIDAYYTTSTSSSTNNFEFFSQLDKGTVDTLLDDHSLVGQIFGQTSQNSQASCDNTPQLSYAGPGNQGTSASPDWNRVLLLTAETSQSSKILSANVPFHDLSPIEQAIQSHLRTSHVSGGAVTSGTLEGLVQFLIIGFGMPGHSSYRDTFLTACSELTTPEDLFNILSRRLSEEPHTSNEGCSTQYKIFVFIVFWLSSNCFSPNEELLYRIKIFCEEAIRLYPSLDSIAKETQQLIDLKVTPPALVRVSKSQEPILRTSDITPSGLAIALGLLEGDNYKALQPFDYLQHLSKGSSERVRIYITTNEKIRLWVIKSILHYDTVSRQSEVIKFFTNTALECYSMRNFSSTAAISIALQSDAVGNLKATTLMGLSKKTHLHSNHRGYYEAIRSTATAQEMETCIPWLVVHLKELYKVVRQPLTVMVDNQHLVNFTRHNQFMDRIKEILYYSPPDLEDRRHGGQLTYLLNQLHDIDLSGDLERQLLTKSEMFSTREENLLLLGF